MRAPNERRVVEALADREPRDSGIAVRRAAVVGRVEPVDADDPQSASSESQGDGTSHRPEPDDDHFGSRRAAQGPALDCPERTRTAPFWRGAGLRPLTVVGQSRVRVVGQSRARASQLSSPGMIVTEAVSDYLAGLKPDPDPVLAEMEAQAEREGIPIVVPETGELLHVLALARGAQRVLEVGTAIGVSTLYLARALPDGGQIVSFEVDEQRHRAARGYLERAGVLHKADLRLEDARAGLASLEGTFDFAFIDGVKAQYGDYFDALLPLLAPRAVLAVDNVLMSGTVAEGRSNGQWTDEQIAGARAFNERLLAQTELSGTVLPVGDGVLVAVRR